MREFDRHWATNCRRDDGRSPGALHTYEFVHRAAADPRFTALTPAQWGFAISFLLSEAMLLWLSMRPVDAPLRV